MSKQPTGKRIQLPKPQSAQQGSSKNRNMTVKQSKPPKLGKPAKSAEPAKQKPREQTSTGTVPGVLESLLIALIQLVCWGLFLLSDTAGANNGSYNLQDAVIFPFIFGFLFFLTHAILSESYDIGGAGQTLLCFLWIILSGGISVFFLMKVFVANEAFATASTFAALLCYAFKYPTYCFFLTFLPPFMIAVTGSAGRKRAFVYEDAGQEAFDRENEKAMMADTQTFIPRCSVFVVPEITVSKGLDFLPEEPSREATIDAPVENTDMDAASVETAPINSENTENPSENDTVMTGNLSSISEMVDLLKKEGTEKDDTPDCPTPSEVPSDSAEVTSATAEPDEEIFPVEEQVVTPTTSESPEAPPEKEEKPDPQIKTVPQKQRPTGQSGGRRSAPPHNRRKSKSRKKKKRGGKRKGKRQRR